MEQRFRLRAVAALALTAVFGCLTLPAAGAAPPDGAKVGQWKTWVLASGSEISVPAPPAENSEQTKAELEELRQLQRARSSITDTAIQYYNALPATQRWHDQLMALMARDKVNANRQFRALGILHTALHDAVVATWAAKYTHNRKPPSQVDPGIAPVISIASEPPPTEPSYPSEHSAVAGTAAGVLAAMFPNDAATFQAMAQEAGQTRLLMGTNYRSDVVAGPPRTAPTPPGPAQCRPAPASGPAPIPWSRCRGPGSRGS
jgi:hypothetical protein